MRQWVMALVMLMLTVCGEAEPVSWLQRCETALAQGRVNEVLQIYQQATRTTATPEQRLIVAVSLGEALWRSGRLDEAGQTLIEASRQVQSLNKPALSGEVALRLGQVAAAKGQTTEAYEYFKQALKQGEQTKQHPLAAAAALNVFKQKPEPALLQQSARHLKQLTDETQQTELTIALAYAALQAGELAQAEQFLGNALALAEQPRQRSQIFGYWGQIAERRQQFEKSLTLTEEAIFADSSPDLLMLWQWQRGRVLSALNRVVEATSAYQQAVAHLQTIKQDIPVNYQYGASSFKTTYAPLYMALIEKLWTAAKADSAKQQTVLEEILKHWEQLKTAELQDYFREACAVQQKKHTIDIAEGTAVLYPILLPERLILLIRFHDALHAVEVAVAYQTVKETIQLLIKELFSPMTGHELAVTGNRPLHQWLLQPLQAELQARHIDTLVYLPDGPLRRVPLSLLSDGRHYVAEQYKVVTIPALSLLEAPRQRHHDQALLVGMSRPGPVVNELVDDDLNIFDGGQTARQERSVRELRDIRQAKTDNRDRSLRAQQLKEALALPGVTVELKKLSNLLQTEALENETFTLENFKQEIAKGMSFVHIASHGYFAGDPKKSFVMAYDHLLNMTQLAHIFRNEAFLQNPVDLVTLSACQTAEGDDRSPLGLSGVVVQTGVKSAIGTLWPVADEAAQAFFSDFYRYYQEAGGSKVQALQTAQQQLMQNEAFKHPLYWAPFVLIGDWH